MKGKLLAFALAVFGIATIGVSQLTVKAAVDSTRDCDQYAVVYCGTLSPKEARDKYNEKDHAKVFQSMGVSLNDLKGTFSEGVVYKDGRVVVDGKTVATGAIMAARNLGGNPIAGTTASKVSVSKMGSAQTAMVKLDQNGKFLFAVMKPCGNPVTATPKEQPPAPEPKAECVELKVIEEGRNRFVATAKAQASDGAKIKAYTFKVFKGDATVYDNTYPNTGNEQSAVYIVNEPGTYRVKAIVDTSEGVKKSQQCEAIFTVKELPPSPTPGVTIEKFVDNDKKYLRVGVNVEYSYRIVVRNTGGTDLNNVKVSDTADDGITLISVSPPNGNVTEKTWEYTIPTLMKGESQTYTLKAKVPTLLAGKLTNTVCVDAPEVPGSPDKCDEAAVDVPPMGKVQVCNPATGEIIEVDETEVGKYIPVGSPECEDQPEEVTVEQTPEVLVLPETGPSETILSVIGAMSLVSSAAYYIASRRNV